MKNNAVKVLPSFVANEWIEGKDINSIVSNPVSGEPIVSVSSEGFDFANVVEYGKKAGSALRNLTFHTRANQITALAKHLQEHKKKFYPVSFMTGATLTDSKIDIDGGISTLFLVASLARRNLPDQKIAYEYGYDELSRGKTFQGKHLLVPKPGVALFINSFNFPCWGMLEKLACAYIAGMPAIVKPATSTSYLAEAVMRELVNSKTLVPGSVQMINGGLGNTFDILGEQDVISFTGSATTALKLRSHKNILAKNIRFNAEADSLNFAYLSEQAVEGTPEYVACVDEVIKELTTKAGQRCTCIRRVFVPDSLVNNFTQSIKSKLEQIVIGDPSDKETMMGALVSKSQHESVTEGVKMLLNENALYFQNKINLTGAFYPPTILLSEVGRVNKLVHELEVFGPVATVIPFKRREEALEGIILGRGSLTGSVYSNDIKEIENILREVSAWHGRINLINRDGVNENPGHGTVMPHMIHGGPGRAGASEELGGVRGIKHYLQRVAVQGNPHLLGKVTGEWGTIKRNPSITPDSEMHPFKKTFDELSIGEGFTTHRRTLTQTDIINFGCLSWDHFYAHFDKEAAERSIFKKPVVHGYLVLSATAGLFVDPAEGPVLANIGLRDLNFLKPVFAEDTIYAELTCKEKTIKPIKDLDIPPHGEVKWQVMVFNQQNEEIAHYTIITLVKRVSD